MKRLDVMLPWFVLWLPAFIITAAVVGLVGIKLFRTPTSPLPSIVGSVPQVALASLEIPRTTQSPDYSLQESPFTYKPPVYIGQTQVELPSATPREKVRVSGVFMVNGGKVCIINGMPYREGGSISQRATIARIDLKQVTIRIGNEEKVLSVGQDSEI